MITCVDCSRVLLNDVKPFDPRTTPTYRAQVHTQIRAARHQHTCPKGTAMQDQCSRCYRREPLPESLLVAMEVNVPEVLEVPSEWADEIETLAQAEADVVEAEILDVDPTDSLAALVAHDDPEIREAAAALQVLIARKQQDWMLRAEIERLMVERDHLTARIAEMQSALLEVLQPAPEPEPVMASAPTAAPTTAEIRDWCKANGMDVPQRGTLPRAAVEAYEAAHEASA